MAKRRYNYIRKKNAPGTKQAGLFAILALLLLISSIVLSVFFNGQGPLFIGALGFSSIFLSISSIYVSIQGIRIKNTNRGFILVSGILSLFIFLFWATLIFLGLAMR